MMHIYSVDLTRLLKKSLIVLTLLNQSMVFLGLHTKSNLRQDLQIRQVKNLYGIRQNASFVKLQSIQGRPGLLKKVMEHFTGQRLTSKSKTHLADHSSVALYNLTFSFQFDSICNTTKLVLNLLKIKLRIFYNLRFSTKINTVEKHLSGVNNLLKLTTSGQ